jgi:hypothetical protein
LSETVQAILHQREVGSFEHSGLADEVEEGWSGEGMIARSSGREGPAYG